MISQNAKNPVSFGWNFMKAKASMRFLLFGLMLLFGLTLIGTSCEEENNPVIEIIPTPSPTPVVNPTRENYFAWNTIMAGDEAKCGYNGSPYMFFSNFTPASDNLLVYLEPGGACWLDESCSPECNHLCSAHLHGLDESLINLWGSLACWLFQRPSSQNPFSNWNFIFVPYCTGDVHIGYNIGEYQTSQGDPVTVHHYGYKNIESVIEYIQEQFPKIDKLAISGSSAGGFGSNINYFRFRDALFYAKESYLIADSGPILSMDENIVGEELADIMKVFYSQVFEAWNVDNLMESLFLDGLPEDYGQFNVWLADRYPEDKLAVVVFTRDYNVSRFMIEKYIQQPTKANILELFDQGLQGMRNLFDAKSNLYYYIPYFRSINDSHCLTIVGHAGTEIQEHDITFYDWMKTMLYSDEMLPSYVESVQPGEDE